MLKIIFIYQLNIYIIQLFPCALRSNTIHWMLDALCLMQLQLVPYQILNVGCIVNNVITTLSIFSELNIEYYSSVLQAIPFDYGI